MEVVVALTIPIAVEAESDASRLCKGVSSTTTKEGELVDKRCTKWSAASAPFEEVEGGGATSIVLKVTEEVDVGVLQPS